MNFKTWLLLTESIEQNFNQWIEDIKKYAQPNELELKTINVDEKQKELIIQALKKANQEKQEYLKYLLGFVKNKPHALPEDFDRSLDAIKWAITTNKINKQQISSDGWYNTGKKAQDIIRMKDEEDSSVSKRQIVRDKKSGISSDLTPEFVSGSFKIYFIPKITDQKIKEDKLEEFSKLKIANERHKIFCKYGKGTGWCTASPTGTYHANYAHRDIYVVHENDKPVFQFTGCTKQDIDDTCQFMDVEDQPAEEIPYELAELIMEKLPDIGKFYDNVYSSFLMGLISITKIKSVDDILKIFQIKTLDKLTDDYIDLLILYSENKEQVAKLIIDYKKELSDVDVYSVMVNLSRKDNRDEIAELIIKTKPDLGELSVASLLFNANNKEKIAELLQKDTDNISKISDYFLVDYFDTDEKQKVAQIINKYHQKKTPEIQKIIDKYL